jgi:hypothetical protein
MYTPEIPEIQTQYDHATEDFVSTAAATVLGAYVGSYIDRHTRIGRWVNNSPTADAIFTILKSIAVVIAVGLFFLYLYFFVTA